MLRMARRQVSTRLCVQGPGRRFLTMCLATLWARSMGCHGRGRSRQEPRLSPGLDVVIKMLSKSGATILGRVACLYDARDVFDSSALGMIER